MTVETASQRSDTWSSTPGRKSIAIHALESLLDRARSETWSDPAWSSAYVQGIEAAIATVLIAEEKCK